MTLKIAYIGAGGFTNAFMYPQLKHHDIDLLAVCDLDEAKARDAERRYGFKKVYTDYVEMLDKEKPDAVFCVGGPKVHHPIGLEVLQRGFPLYVQKPPASSSAKAQEMADAAKQSGVVCHVGFNLRFAPAIRKAKEIIGGGEFGTPLEGIFRYGLASTPDFRFNVIDQHCHIMDTTRYLMGDPNTVSALRSGIENARDYVAALRFESGAVGTVNCTSGQPFEKEFLYFEVTGEGNLLFSHGFDELVWRRGMDHPWWKDPRPEQVFNRGGYGLDLHLETFGYVGDVDNFLGAVKGEQEDLSPVSDTVGTLKLCEEILAQLETEAEKEQNQ
ncbi:MAG: Gfo/Idh/MocA family oxidoreductase [Candidatus Omnitrophica bacterium]|nr:Gfo/Idh/MocA family oxidoreductase [Candidatus Omnitrophota bacterium]